MYSTRTLYINVEGIRLALYESESFANLSDGVSRCEHYNRESKDRTAMVLVDEEKRVVYPTEEVIDRWVQTDGEINVQTA